MSCLEHKYMNYLQDQKKALQLIHQELDERKYKMVALK